LSLLLPVMAAAQEGLNRVPSEWKWISPTEAAFTFDGTYGDAGAFISDLDGNKRFGIPAGLRTPKAGTESGLENPTLSPDRSLTAFTRAGNLFVREDASGKVVQLTSDGSDVVYNGYAAWVYYEEIFGRKSSYRAFWWAPDSRTLAFYRFDETDVPEFPIYSPKGEKGGTLRVTHYPKAGDPNPKVQIGFVALDGLFAGRAPKVVWADFDPSQDQYFGKPFWAPDGKRFFIPREPRIQNTLELFAVDASTGSKTSVYREQVATWLDWIDGPLFTDKGLYIVRDFESGWQQIYFLGYDGSLKRLTDGTNWNVKLLKADAAGNVFFLANRDSQVRKSLCKVSPKGVVTVLTDPALNVGRCEISPDGKYYIASLSSLSEPVTVVLGETAPKKKKSPFPRLLCDMKGPRYKADDYPVTKLVSITVDGLEIPGTVTFPKGFDPAKKYPVHIYLYGGPDTPVVSDTWRTPGFEDNWFYENGIIAARIDNRASGHNGREGLDQIYKHLNTIELKDFVEWGKYFQGLPYVKADRIGVEGFSFGGTMTAALLLKAPEVFCCGIAGGGVYDWMLYDSHYTERFMSTPEDNPEGYWASRVIDYARGASGRSRLKLTHGTGDDNVHFQNTLLLVDALQEAGVEFDLMVYPDGMHGYRGYQGSHSVLTDLIFWKKYLLE
jgi:dipeptidyl-peptidase-4